MTEDGPDTGDTRQQDLRSFGRRRGRRLSDRQHRLLTDLLPRLALDLGTPAPSDLTTLFPGAPGEVWLEIGFGGGEHLLWQARANPHVGLIGCEPFEEGVVKVLAAIETEARANIRLHADDARDVLRWLAPASLDRAFILFADPWPKRRHQKRRLINVSTLELLARVLRPGATLRIATDIPDYLRTIFIAMRNHRAVFRWTARSPDDWRNRPSDWPPTRYEAKAIREGRRCCYLTFVRN